jgi:hypothetical protein
MCHMHYRREKRHGSPHSVQRDHTPRHCSVQGCERITEAQGLCGMHYQRHLRGTPNQEVPGLLVGGSLAERANRHVPAPDADGHQVWTAQITGRETPLLKLASTTLSARRVLWQQHHGEAPPEEMLVIASCGVDRCVAADHLVLAERGYHNRKPVTSR